MIDDWLEQHRFVTLSFVLLIIFLIIISFLVLKADEITRDPCSICAEKMGEDVSCTLMRGIPITKTYLPNGSSYDNKEEIRKIVDEEIEKNKIDVNYSVIFNLP